MTEESQRKLSKCNLSAATKAHLSTYLNHKTLIIEDRQFCLPFCRQMCKMIQVQKVKNKTRQI